MATAPWLIPTDVIRAASAGAQVGLSARDKDLKALRMANAVNQFQQSIAQRAFENNAQRAAQQEAIAARLAEQLREQDALAMYQQQQDALAREKLRVEQSIADKRLQTEGARQTALDEWRNRQLENTTRRLDLQEKRDSKPPTISPSSNPEAIIARERLRQALSGMPVLDKAGVAAAEDLLRKALMPPSAATNAPAMNQETPDTIKAAYKAGQLTRDEAINRLRALGYD